MSILISFFLILVVTKAYLDVAENSRVLRINSEMTQTASEVLDVIQRNAYLSSYSPIKNGERVFTGLGLKGCSPVCEGTYGTNSVAIKSFNDLRNPMGGSGSDAIVFRFVGTSENSQTKNGVPVNCTNTQVTPNVINGVQQSIVENRFYIPNDGRKVLTCIGNTSTAVPAVAFSNPAVISNEVEDMKVEYGVTRIGSPGSIPFHQISGYMKASQFNSDMDWASVMSLNICLLVRSTQKLNDQTAPNSSNYIDCNDVKTSANDGYLRRSFRRTIFLRNSREALPNPRQVIDSKVADPYTGVNAE